MATKKNDQNFTDAQSRQLGALVTERNVIQGNLDRFVAYLADETGIIGENGWAIAKDFSGFVKADVVNDAGL